MIMEKCPDLIITGKAAAAHYTLFVLGGIVSRHPEQHTMTVYKANDDVIFSETSENLTDLVRRACKVINDR